MLTGRTSFLVFNFKLDTQLNKIKECEAPVSNKTLIPVEKRMRLPSMTVWSSWSPAGLSEKNRPPELPCVCGGTRR
ncbi:hypothetical protein LguiB_031997 [Lonicera macranthoides]